MAFEGLSSRLQAITRKLGGKARITESDLKDVLREVKLALLEADVNYKIVKEFISDVEQKALGQDVLKSLTPGQQVVKIVRDEMTELFDEAKKIVCDIDHLLMEYHQGNNVIEDIKKKYNNLADLVKKEKDNSSYVFFEKMADIIHKKNLLRSLHALMRKERNIDNVKLFEKLEELLKLIETINYC